MINIETKSCPKCGEGAAFKDAKPRYRSREYLDYRLNPNAAEWLEYECVKCGYPLRILKPTDDHKAG